MSLATIEAPRFQNEYAGYKRSLSLITTENIHSVPGLAEKVAKIRKSPTDASMYLLPDTGFHVKDQVRLMSESLSSGTSFKDAMSQVEQDIQGFKVEYLCEQPVFPIVLDKKEYNGRTRLVGALYGDKPLAETTSADERGGVVKKSIEEIENYLLAAKPGAMAVMTSPRGWSGYQSKEGSLEKHNEEDVKLGRAKAITYPDSQTYCFQVQKDGSIRGFTLKTNMDIYQNEALLKRLGVGERKFTQHTDHKDRIKQAVSNVAYIEPAKGLTIEKVADSIQDIKKTDVAYRDSTQKARTFSEMKALLASPESLWTLDGTTKKLVNEMRDYIEWGIEGGTIDTQDIEIALGYTVLALMHEVRPPVLAVDAYIRPNRNYDVRALPPAPAFFDPRETLGQMQKLAGCAGGGGSNSSSSNVTTSIVSSVTPRIGVEGGKKILCCTCPFCGKEVEAEISGGKISCPKCNESAEWSEQAGGE